MKRLFIAIDIPFNTKISALFTTLKKNLSEERIKWVEQDNFHITLKFLGETEEFYLNSLIQLLQQVSYRYPPFNIQLKRAGIFGNQHNPRVIWIGINQNEILVNLKTTIDKELFELGFDPDSKFSPHLTLGRIKQIRNYNNLKEIIQNNNETDFGEFPINGFILFESILKSNGPEYKMIEEFTLTG
jgi:RNA 2',3'-cyclic 3'-phosphodiesterase